MNQQAIKRFEERSRYPAALWYLLACFLFSLFFLLFQGGKLASMLFIVMTILSVYLLLGNWSGIKKTQGARTLFNADQEIHLDAGQSLQVQIKLQIPGVWPIPYVMIKDKLIRQNGDEAVFEGSLVPDWKRRGQMEYTTPPLRRGFYHFGTTECYTEDIFGLFQHRGRLVMEQSLAVHPQVVSIKKWVQFHQMLKGMQHHSASTRAHRETTQINGVREYIYGDRLSRIHWNATAKTGTWKSKEFERESLPKTVIMLDRTHQSYQDAASFELAVSVAASLFRYGASRELALGLLSVGSEATYLEPKISHSQHKIAMNHLVRVEADGVHDLYQVVKDRSRQMSPGSFFVLISPMKGAAMMQILSWLHQQQMNPCHIWVRSSAAKQTAIPEEAAQHISSRDDWIKQVRSKGYMGYEIAQLAELPNLLGGARHHA